MQIRWADQIKSLLLLIIVQTFIFVLSAQILSSFYAVNPYGPDPGPQMLKYANAHQTIEQSGVIDFVKNEISTNKKNPFPIVATTFLGRNLLLLPYGQSVFTFLLMLAFSLLLTRNFLRRSIPFYLAVIPAIVAITARVVYSSYFGVAFNLPDNAAAWALGAAVLSILEFTNSGQRKWLTISAIMISIAVLTRYIFCMYSFLVIGPILALHFFNMEKAKRTAFIKEMLWYLLIIIIGCGWFLFLHLKENLFYYTYYQDADKGTEGVGYIRSAVSLIITIKNFLALPHMIAIGIVVLTFFKTSPKKSGIFKDVLIPLWIFAALPLFYVFYLQADGIKVASAYWPIAPLLFVALFYVFEKLIPFLSYQFTRIILIVLLITSVYGVVRGRARVYDVMGSEPAHEKVIQRQIADQYVFLDRPNCNDSIGDVIAEAGLAEAVSLEIVYRFNRFPFSYFDLQYNRHQLSLNDAVQQILSCRFILAFESKEDLEKYFLVHKDPFAKELAEKVMIAMQDPTKGYAKKFAFKLKTGEGGAIYFKTASTLR